MADDNTNPLARLHPDDIKAIASQVQAAQGQGGSSGLPGFAPPQSYWDAAAKRLSRDPLGDVARSNTRPMGKTDESAWRATFGAKPDYSGAVGPGKVVSNSDPVQRLLDAALGRSSGSVVQNDGSAMATRNITGLPSGQRGSATFIPGQNANVGTPAAPSASGAVVSISPAASPFLQSDPSMFSLPKLSLNLTDLSKVPAPQVKPIGTAPAAPALPSGAPDVPRLDSAPNPALKESPLKSAFKPQESAGPPAPQTKQKGRFAGMDAPYGFGADDQWEMLGNAGKWGKGLFFDKDGNWSPLGARNISLVK